MRWRSRTVSWVAALSAGLLVLLTGCGGPAGRDAPHAPLQALLDRQAEAVLAGDRAAYLATVDPLADRYRAAQRTVFGNLARLPLSQWSYRVTAVGDDAFPLPGRGGGARRIAVRAELSYRVEGYDTAPVRAEENLTLTERQDRWYVSSERDGTEQLWEQGRMTVVRGERSLVLGVGRPGEGLRALAADADRAVPAVAARWPRDWSRRVLVEAPASVEGMAALLGGDPDSYRGIAAVTTGEAGGPGRDAKPAERIVVNPRAYGVLGERGRRIVMTHETTHVATRRYTTAATPMWLSEGFADWVAYHGTGRPPTLVAPRLTEAARRGELPEELPADEDFGFAGDGGRLARAYEGGWLACRMVAERWGEGKLTELYLRTGRNGPPGDGDGGEARKRAVDAALREVLGTDLAGFTAHWRDHVRRELGG
ncbi:hypothetical protein CUT44_07705 [Streptomyces carminius]|uniref:Lipoprotein n=1 Tax=Streptomyces carminius TaxID=2665496 RepID=A0A2M8M2Y6_9ACTN|nr:hypothetical protein [Streptomyces carminius]PJE98564.1 hypothetical protein CUT44_07705 [Streptomyces carminius]